MPPWLRIARSYVGLREIPGKFHNPTILGWLKRHALNIGKWGKGRDETPWCAVFVSHCLHEAGYEATNNARAASYISYGRASIPKQGAIVVIRRRKKNGPNVTGSGRGGYHVLFLDKFTKQFIKGWGGNQRNRVSYASYSKANYEVCAIRWPVQSTGEEPASK
jgi:uncharacterized protein (TIGR02594 family)